MPASVFTHPESSGLAYVVEKHGVAHDGLRRRERRGAHHVLPHRIDVVRVALVEADARPYLRDEDRDDVGVFEQHVHDEIPADKAPKLHLDALGRHLRQQFAIRVQCRRRVRLDGKPAHCRKTQRPQYAQRVFGETLAGTPHRAQYAGRQVLAPARRVHKPARGTVGHRVHGKVASQQVAFHIIDEIDGVRVPAIAVGALRAKGRDLVGRVLDDGRDRAVLQTCLHIRDAGRGKAGLDFVRTRVCRDVPIVRIQAAQRVAHAAAHHVGLMSTRL